MEAFGAGGGTVKSKDWGNRGRSRSSMNHGGVLDDVPGSVLRHRKIMDSRFPQQLQWVSIRFWLFAKPQPTEPKRSWNPFLPWAWLGSSSHLSIPGPFLVEQSHGFVSRFSQLVLVWLFGACHPVNIRFVWLNWKAVGLFFGLHLLGQPLGLPCKVLRIRDLGGPRLDRIEPLPEGRLCLWALPMNR